MQLVSLRVVALMTRDNSMDGKAFEVFIEKCLAPQLWSGAVVVMDNLPAHKLASIEPMIVVVAASILCLSPEVLNDRKRLPKLPAKGIMAEL